jgi:hypothetical protein
MGLFGKKQFQSKEEALEFLVSKIANEAEMQGCPLNDHERKALKYAADEPSTEWGLDWDKVRGSEWEGAEFETQMTALLKSAYERDKTAGEDIARYKSASRMIEGEPYWIVAISTKAVPQGLF